MFDFYDIESLENVFSLCNYDQKNNKVDVYVKSDDEHLIQNLTPTMLYNYVKKEIPYFDANIVLRNLDHEQNIEHLAQTFGLSTARSKSDRSDYGDKYRLVSDTDPEYNLDEHHYYLGYNSYNYDTVMLSLFLHEAFNLTQTQTTDPITGKPITNTSIKIHAPTAKKMRAYNDQLFTKEFKENMPSFLAYDSIENISNNYSDTKYKIRRHMLQSGRHIDVARLNEKQSKVSLKRLSGMLGFQIKESDKLKNETKINTVEELLDLLAYNIADILNLKFLFDHELYQGQFELKKGLLETYPELRYKQHEDRYEPDINPYNVRNDRLYIDSRSAQFAAKILCPYGHLSDQPTVSFLYPSQEIAEEYNMPRINVLDKTYEFFKKHFGEMPHVMNEFIPIYNYYKSIEGKNFNHSKNYKTDFYGTPNYHEPIKISSIPKPKMAIPYYDAQGKPTSTYVVFSTGGIHGAEYNLKLYEHDLAAFEQKQSDFMFIKNAFPDPLMLKEKENKTITMLDGRVLKSTDFLKSGSTKKQAAFKDFKKDEPILFVFDKAKDQYVLNKRYFYTSADLVSHQDFKSYYPNLLRMLMAFYNEGLGDDRYAIIFNQKENYGKLMKDKSIAQMQRKLYAVLREGTKLVMNSASGAGDAGFDNNIIMNNNIIAMRIIGQLFTYTIGQAQTLYGAKITSTNTDGLYSYMQDTKLNDRILAQESKAINVEIEPELMYLISKDTNNRLEMDYKTGEVLSTAGATLGCYKGPHPSKALTHPAIIDWALGEYLITASLNECNLSLSKPLDKDFAMIIFDHAKKKFDSTKYLLMFQNILASSTSSNTYNFAIDEQNPNRAIALQHVNRIFLVKDGTPDACYMQAATARIITDATKKRRERDGVRLRQHDPKALTILAKNGYMEADIPIEREAVIKKITNLSPDWPVIIENNSLHFMSEARRQAIIDSLDINKYMTLLEQAYNTWKNLSPDEEPTTPSSDNEFEFDSVA